MRLSIIGLTAVDKISEDNSTIVSNSFDEEKLREIVNDSIDYYLGR